MSSSNLSSTLRRRTGVDFGKCVNFDQSTSAISYATPAALTSTTSDFSYFQYFTINTIDATARRLIDQSNQGLLVLYNTSNMQVQVRYSSTNGLVTIPLSNLPRFVTHDLVVIWSNSFNYPAVYLDGMLVVSGTNNKAGTRLAAGVTTYLGNRSGSDRPFSGQLDKHAFISRQATFAEVSAFHQQGLLPSNALVAYEMDETSGNLVDASGNGVTGTPSNVTQGVASFGTIPARTLAGQRQPAIGRLSIS